MGLSSIFKGRITVAVQFQEIQAFYLWLFGLYFPKQSLKQKLGASRKVTTMEQFNTLFYTFFTLKFPYKFPYESQYIFLISMLFFFHLYCSRLKMMGYFCRYTDLGHLNWDTREGIKKQRNHKRMSKVFMYVKNKRI